MDQERLQKGIEVPAQPKKGGKTMFEAVIFDTETTRIDSPEIIEAALISVTDLPDLAIEAHTQALYRPSGAISLGAMAVHHIMEEDLVNCPPSNSFRLPEQTRYLIGHNVDFDWRAAGSPAGVKRICTLALCRSLFPEADSHSLGAMMYLLHRESAREMVKGAHSALMDCLMCRQILLAILPLAVTTFEELWQVSEAARVPKIMPFGKHKGIPIGQLPADYRRWLLGQSDIDPYLRQALSA